MDPLVEGRPPADHPAAQWRYEGLLLAQPQVETGGLWFKDGAYFVVCPRLQDGLKARDGRALEQWFVEQTIICERPIDLVTEAPHGATQIEPRTLEAIAFGHGATRTMGDVHTDLALALPSAFPRFTCEIAFQTLTVTVERDLDPDERADLEREVARLGLDAGLVIEIGPDAAKSPERHPFELGDLTLTSTRSQGSLPQQLRWLVEDDEDFWVSHRMPLLTSAEIARPASVLPSTWNRTGLTCVVNASTVPPSNLRNYLSIFRRAVVVAPIATALDNWCQSFGVTADDLIQLLSLGRLQLLLPHSVDRTPSPG